MDTAAMMPVDEAQEAEYGPEAGAIKLCIEVASDGGLSVYASTDEATDGGEQRSPAADIGDALKQLLALYRGLELPETSAQDQFRSGYEKSTAGRNR